LNKFYYFLSTSLFISDLTIFSTIFCIAPSEKLLFCYELIDSDFSSKTWIGFKMSFDWVSLFLEKDLYSSFQADSNK